MIAPTFPDNEAERQAAVEKYQLLDTLPEECFDNITSLVSYICETPISLITMMDYDRNFLKSHHGVELSESPREISFCGHTIASPDPITIIEDARIDERFSDNPLVTEFQAIFYAGVPLVDPDGYKLGTLCVYDHKPRQLTKEQKQALFMLSKQVVRLMVQHYQNLQLNLLKNILQERNKELSQFARTVSHDLKSPLNNIIALTDLIESENHDVSEYMGKYLTYLRSSADTLKLYIDRILEFYQLDKMIDDAPDEINFSDVMEEIKQLTAYEDDCKLTWEGTPETIRVNRAALMHILLNLISNSFKYNRKKERNVNVSLSEENDQFVFHITDNGDGIPQDNIDDIFNMFTVAVAKDRYGRKGTGLGLSSVKKLVTKLGGEISVESIENEGSTFTFTLPTRANSNPLAANTSTV